LISLLSLQISLYIFAILFYINFQKGGDKNDKADNNILFYVDFIRYRIVHIIQGIDVQLFIIKEKQKRCKENTSISRPFKSLYF
jgi:hypothetical protein